MKIIKASVIILLILVLGANAIDIFDKECKTDGSIRLVLKADSKAMAYTADMQIKAGETAISGTFDNQYIVISGTSAREYATFQSKENVLTSKRPYPINIEYKLTQEDGTKTDETQSLGIECPGVIFTCEELNISIESCENQGDLFRAVLNVKGLEQSKEAMMGLLQVVDFQLETENKYKDMDGKETSKGTLPEKAQAVRLEKDKYVIRYEFSSKNPNTVKILRASYNTNLKYPCDTEKYPEVKFYDSIECKRVEATQEVEPKKDVAIQTQAVKEQSKETQTETKKTADQIIQQEPKNYKPLAVISMILVGVLGFGGIILSYLYRRGYI